MNPKITVNVYPSVGQQDEPDGWIITELLEASRKNGSLKDLIKKVRETSTKAERDVAKLRLPVFRPCIHNDQLTGLVQFDVDHYDQTDSATSKNVLIQKFPSLHYAFLSPSGGLKFALFTDIAGNSKEHFGVAYDILEKAVREVIGNDIKLDTACRSAHQLCYLSYDPESYINPEAEILKIASKVKEITSKLPSPPEPKAVAIIETDQDHKICLDAIDSIRTGQTLPKKDRITLAKAIKTVFGFHKAIQIIQNNLGYFKGDTGYLGSILTGDNQYGTGTIIYYARKNGFKNVTETFKENKLGGDHKRVTFIPKTENKFERMDVKEASARIEKRVSQFLEQRISIQLMVEMGTGKTQTTLQKLIEYLDDRDSRETPLKIAMFVPTHKLGAQSLEKLLKYEGEKIVGDGYSLGQKRFHKVIGGFSKHCAKLNGLSESERKGITRSAYECEKCEYMDTICWYAWQFWKQDDLIRIYPHNYLFSPSKLDKDYQPDLVVIDEDPISHVIQDHTYEKRNGKIWKIILDEGLDAVISADISKAIKLLNLQIIGLTPKAKSGAVDAVLLNKLYEELEDVKRLKSIKLNGNGKNGAVSVYSNKVHIARKILPDPKWMKSPVLYLNGTGNNEITEAIFGKDNFQITEEIRVKYNPNVKVIQVQNKTFSKSQVTENSATKKQLFDLVSYLYHYKKCCFVSYQSFVEEILKNNPGYNPDRFMYFGYTRGENLFENNNVILVIGRQYLPRQAISLKGTILFGEDLDSKVDNFTRTIELRDPDQNAQIDCQDFVNDRMKMLGRYFNEGETLQSINRLRLIHGNEKKTVIYLSNNVVNGLCVNDLKIVDDILVSQERMKLIKSVQATGKIQSKPKILAEASGLTPKQVSNLKSKKWFKDNIFFTTDDTGHLVDKLK